MPRAVNSASPVGSVIDLPVTTAPDMYLFCNGAAVSRTTYAALFAVIGTAHGSGDGSTTFNLPDRRGYFTRGTDGGAGRDPDTSTRTAMNTGGNTGDNVGSVQASQYGSHSHPYSGTTASLVDGGLGSHTHSYAHDADVQFGGGGNGPPVSAGITTPNLSTTSASNIAHEHTYSGTTTSEGGNETRGINAYTNYFIRY